MDDAPTSMVFSVARPIGRAMDPAPADEGRLRPADSAARAFVLIANSALSQIAANAAVLRQARRLEAVHQLRVGLRRLRGALALFGPMLAGEDLDRVKAELKWLTAELNDARDLDVFIAETFRPAARRRRDWPGMAAFGKALLTAQTKAYDRAQTAARSARFGVLMLETAAWLDCGQWTTDSDPKMTSLRARPIAKQAPELLRDSYHRLIKRGRKLASLDADARHKLRLRAKRLRYATGFFADLYAGADAKTHRRFDNVMKQLQTALGRQTDIAVAVGLAAEIAGARAGDTAAAGSATLSAAFAAGLIAAHRAAGETEAKAAALKAYRRFEDAKPFW